jgi:HAE1 family hydrophobic/amphiphilic exporter-1
VRETQGIDSYSKRDRLITLDVNIQVNGNPAEYRQQIISFLKEEVILPDGVRFDFTGSSRDLNEGLAQFGFAGIASIILMYMIMAALFENFRDPFIIWLCIFIALFGAVFFLSMLGNSLSTTAIIGLFMLVGIIVNNGIVLVDYMHIYTKDQAFDETLIDKVLEACRRRMRPVILTALTTICSMVPLAIEIGSGSEIWSPLAKTVIGGLLFGTFLTLFVIPSLVMGISKDRRKAIKLAK